MDATRRQQLPIRKLALAALLVSTAMLFVSMFLAALGVVALQVSGGADTDTGSVVVLAAVLIGDFWGGALLLSLSRAPIRHALTAWLAARAIWIALLAAAGMSPLLLAAIAVLAGPSAWAGMRMRNVQVALRTQHAERREV